MMISLHFVLAVVLVVTACLAVVGGRTPGMSTHRVPRLFTVAVALLLAPSNVVMLASGAVGTSAMWVVVGSVAVLLVQVVLWVQALWPVTRATSPRRVLAIAAHADDLERACGATLTRLVDAGHEVHALVLGSDAEPGPARHPGVTDLTVIGLPSSHLGEFTTDLAEAIATKVTALNPDFILTPGGRDHDSDHLAVHSATRLAVPDHPAVVAYETPAHAAADRDVDVTRLDHDEPTQVLFRQDPGLDIARGPAGRPTLQDRRHGISA